MKSNNDENFNTRIMNVAPFNYVNSSLFFSNSNSSLSGQNLETKLFFFFSSWEYQVQYFLYKILHDIRVFLYIIYSGYIFSSRCKMF